MDSTTTQTGARDTTYEALDAWKRDVDAKKGRFHFFPVARLKVVTKDGKESLALWSIMDRIFYRCGLQREGTSLESVAKFLEERAQTDKQFLENKERKVSLACLGAKCERYENKKHPGSSTSTDPSSIFKSLLRWSTVPVSTTVPQDNNSTATAIDTSKTAVWTTQQGAHMGSLAEDCSATYARTYIPNASCCGIENVRQGGGDQQNSAVIGGTLCSINSVLKFLWGLPCITKLVEREAPKPNLVESEAAKTKLVKGEAAKTKLVEDEKPDMPTLLNSLFGLFSKQVKLVELPRTTDAETPQQYLEPVRQGEPALQKVIEGLSRIKDGGLKKGELYDAGEILSDVAPFLVPSGSQGEAAQIPLEVVQLHMPQRPKEKKAEEWTIDAQAYFTDGYAQKVDENPEEAVVLKFLRDESTEDERRTVGALLGSQDEGGPGHDKNNSLAPAEAGTATVTTTTAVSIEDKNKTKEANEQRQELLKKATKLYRAHKVKLKLAQNPESFVLNIQRYWEEPTERDFQTALTDPLFKDKVDPATDLCKLNAQVADAGEKLEKLKAEASSPAQATQWKELQAEQEKARQHLTAARRGLAAAHLGRRHDQTPIQLPGYIEPNGPGNKPKYRLRAILVHDGGFSCTGHFKTFLPYLEGERSPTDHETRWFSHSDALVRELPFKDMESYVSKHAYLVAYERM